MRTTTSAITSAKEPARLITQSTRNKPTLPASLSYAEPSTKGSWTWLTCYQGFGVVSLCVAKAAQ